MAVTMRLNKEREGIELLFPDSERPSAEVKFAMKDLGFRWHHTGKYWFARQNPDRLRFAEKLAGVPEKETTVQKEPEKKTEDGRKGKKAEKAPKQENTFASVYDCIGSCKIQDHSDIDLHQIPSSGVYCKATNAYFRHTWGYGDGITVTDLTNAGKTGKSCTTWRLYPEEPKGIVSNHLTGEENLKTCADLIQALREGKPLESVKVNSAENKGIDVFSPFVEVKPLTKMPEEWNKRNLTAALLSGQIYMGQVDYRYTDDYAMDAVYNFSEGVGINIPSFARDVVEDWSSSYYIRMNSKDAEKNTCSIGFSEHSNSSKTLQFDLNCDLREGKRRAEERAAGIEAYNTMMKASCIQVPRDSIDSNQIYSVTSLDMFSNTGIYGTKTELMQGSALLERTSEDWQCLDVLSANVQQIVPDKLYEIASFYHRANHGDLDDRIIDCGNYLQLVTGKALLELTAEGVGLPHIREATGEYRTIESARDNLKKFISGDQMFMFSGLKTEGYQTALDKLNREAARAGHENHSRSGLNDLIGAAQKKAAMQASSANKKSMDLSR